MKILEAQNALLSNFEVYELLSERQTRFAKEKQNKNRRRGPGNLETLSRELLQYFCTPPGPLSQQPTLYSAEAVQTLVQRLAPYELTKGELLMVLNMRPTQPAHLHVCIEEIGERLSEEQQLELLDIVAEVLGAPAA